MKRFQVVNTIGKAYTCGGISFDPQAGPVIVELDEKADPDAIAALQHQAGLSGRPVTPGLSQRVALLVTEIADAPPPPPVVKAPPPAEKSESPADKSGKAGSKGSSK